MARTLVIGDTHAPFTHRDARPFLAAVADRYQPNRIIHIGDVGDFHGLSRYVRNPAGRSAGDEASLAIKQLGGLYTLFPDVEVIEGNHDRRLRDRAEEVGIPNKFLRTLPEVLEFPKGWSYADSYEHEGTVYEHGDPFLGKDAHLKAASANMANTVIGHVHAHAGIAYLANRRHLIWGFNVGCLIDHKQYAFNYAKRWAAKPIIGCGIVDGRVPFFVPMNLKPNGRWAGRL